MLELNKPTQEQIKEFWEWCGFFKVTYTDAMPWRFPVDKFNECFFELPRIDLNNLFKYAPEKLNAKADLHINFHEIHWAGGQIFTECVITRDNYEIGKALLKGRLEDMAKDALFWACLKIYPPLLETAHKNGSK